MDLSIITENNNQIMQRGINLGDTIATENLFTGK